VLVLLVVSLHKLQLLAALRCESGSVDALQRSSCSFVLGDNCDTAIICYRVLLYILLHLFYTSADTKCTIVELGVSATQQFYDSGRRRVMSAAFNLLLLMLLLLLLGYGLHLSSRPH